MYEGIKYKLLIIKGLLIEVKKYGKLFE